MSAMKNKKIIEVAKKTSKEIINDLHDNNLAIPRVPHLIKKIDTLLNSDTASLNEIAKVIELEPSLSVRVIQVANSPVFRASKKINTIKDALLRIGTKQVRNLVFCLSIKDMVRTKGPILTNIFSDVWKHSVRVGLLAALLSERYQIDRDEAMLAGILHDLGILPIINKLDVDPLVNAIESETEQELLSKYVIGRLHMGIGKKVLEYWNFPDEYIKVALEHHNIEQINDSDISLSDIIKVAEYFDVYKNGRLWQIKTNDNFDFDSSKVAKKLKITEREIQALLNILEEEIKEIKELFE